MKGANPGEFEELVLLTVAALTEEAYSVAICDELLNHTGRSVKLGVGACLEEKGLVKSQLGEATKTRGGKCKRCYQLTIPGKTALVRAKSMRDQLWGQYTVACLEKSVSMKCPSASRPKKMIIIHGHSI